MSAAEPVLYDDILKALTPVAVAALGGGFTWLTMRRKTKAEAKAVLEDILNDRMQLVITAYENRVKDLKDEVAALHAREAAREAEIVSLRQALDSKTMEIVDLKGGQYDGHRTVAFVPSDDDQAD